MEEKILGKCSNCGAEVEIAKDGRYTCENCHISVGRLCLEEPQIATPCVLCGGSVPIRFGDFGSSKVCGDCKALWGKLKFEFMQGRFSHE